MNTTSERFDRAIKALVKGYINNTLVKGSCAACAVGNIVAESIGIPKIDYLCLEEKEHIRGLQWANVCMTSNGIQQVHPSRYEGMAKEEIDATGYSWKEIAEIEYIFETNTNIHWGLYNSYSPSEIDKDQLNGLNAVIEVLCKIEGLFNEDQINGYKKLLIKESQL